MPGLISRAWGALAAPGGFGRFLASGGFNTLATYALYLLLLRWLPYAVSYSIAFASGIALAYALNRFVVFRQSGGRHAMLWVTAIYLGQYLVSLAIVRLCVEWMSVPAPAAPLVAIVLTLPVTYLLNRVVFSDRRAQVAADVAASVAAGRAHLPALGVAALVGLPVLSLVLNAVHWLRFGLDLPFFDDWRGYDFGDIDSLDFIYLFRPLNDTLTPIGLALDALAQRWLDGNSIAYQLLSMLLVLGGLLLLQWKLLRTVLGDRLRTAVCFLFTLPMLQPHSYWGRENLAYQQALPLVALLAALWLVVDGRRREWWALPAVFVLGQFAGFTYISGAFGALAAGAGLLVALALSGHVAAHGRMLRGGATLLASGAVASAVQVWMVIVPQRGQTHVGAGTMALPHEADFWWFYLGKIGRALLLPEAMPALSLALVVAACVAVVWLATSLVRQARVAPADAPVRGVVAILGALVALVFVYLLMVAAGRANFRPAGVEEPLQVFAWGFTRFHFFWATLLWPWVIAGVFLLSRARVGAGSSTPAAMRITGGVVLAGLAVAMVAGGALSHEEAHRREAKARHPTIACLSAKLQTGGPIDCPEFNLPDLSPAMAYARYLDASFVRYFPIHPVALGANAPAPWFRWSRDADRVRVVNGERLAGGAWRSHGDVQLLIDVGRPEAMGQCAMLDVQGRIRTTAPNTVMAFFLPWGQSQYTAKASDMQAIGPDRDTFHLRLEHPQGFGDTLRLDPVEGAGEFEILDLEVRCRLRSRTEGIEPFFSMAQTRQPATLHRLEPVAGQAGAFRAGDESHAVFRTGYRYRMATCRVLEVEVRYAVEQDDAAQLYFRPRGVGAFNEQHSRTLALRASGEPRRLVFVVESPGGFHDALRFDPVRQPQTIRFDNLEVRCLKRTLRVRDDD